MNKKNRKIIEYALAKVLEAKAELLEAQDLMYEVMQDEQDKLYNIPDNMQDGERAEAFQNAIDVLEDYIDSLGSICDDIDNLNIEVEEL